MEGWREGGREGEYSRATNISSSLVDNAHIAQLTLVPTAPG